jgi:hypothetical protein
MALAGRGASREVECKIDVGRLMTRRCSGGDPPRVCEDRLLKSRIELQNRNQQPKREWSPPPVLQLIQASCRGISSG